MSKNTTPTMNDLEATARALEAGKRTEPIEWMGRRTYDGSGRGTRVVAFPFGGKDTPSHAVIKLLAADYDEDGKQTGERIVATLEEETPHGRRGVLVAWASVATRSARTENRLNEAISSEWRKELRSGYGLPEAARLPLEVEEAMRRSRRFLASGLGVLPSEVPTEDAVKTAKLFASHLAGYIGEDGEYRAPVETKKAKKAKK